MERWTEARLQKLIADGEHESLTLEFKSCDALANSDPKKNEVSKDVASFANSAGGTIIYGIRELNHIATALDTGYDPALVSKEWLENVINSRIQRRIDGVVISAVPLLTTNPGRVAYIVEIPQSMRAPHQSFDKRFYKRFNFQSVPMEEYEVRDASQRASGPLLEISFAPDPLPQVDSEPTLAGAWSRLDIRPSITNHSAVPAEYASLYLYVDARLAVVSSCGISQAKGVFSASIGGQMYRASVFHINWAVPGKMPIFEGIHFSLGDHGSPFEVRPPEFGTYLLGWKAMGPRMQVQTGLATIELTSSSCTYRPGDA